jgi:hypothetical protein
VLRKPRLARSLVLAVIAMLATAASASADEAMTLDLRQSTQPGGAGPVTTAAPLAAGQPYIVTVSGTASIWPIDRWSAGPICGAAERAPMFPTPGVANGPTGLDAETVFAVPPGAPFPGFPCGPSTIPFHVFLHQPVGLQMNGGGGFIYVVPVGGPYGAPRPDHTYTYAITGAGAPLSIRFADEPVGDNYGLLRIAVRPRQPCDDTGTCAAPSAPAIDVAGLAVGLPGARTCLSRRRFAVHFRSPRGVRIVSARLELAGRRFVAHKGKGGVLRATVDLRRLPKGVYKLTLRAKTNRGQSIASSRRYRTCAPARRG